MGVEEWIQRSIVRPTPEARRGTLALPPHFQGWPHIAHGGGVLACLYEIARPFLPGGTPVQATVRLHRSVGLDRPLNWSLTRDQGGIGVTIEDEDRLLAEGRVERSTESIPPAILPLPDGQAPAVPGNAGCLACGSENPIGLQIRFHWDEQAVWKVYRPRPPYRCADGSLAPALHTIVLDEIGWWLGVLSAGECGLTTEIAVEILHPIPFDVPILIHGSRAAVTPEDGRGRIWRAEATVSADACTVARGRVRFAGTRGFTKRLIPDFLAASHPDEVRRLFSRYVDRADLPGGKE